MACFFFFQVFSSRSISGPLGDITWLKRETDRRGAGASGYIYILGARSHSNLALEMQCVSCFRRLPRFAATQLQKGEAGIFSRSFLKRPRSFFVFVFLSWEKNGVITFEIATQIQCKAVLFVSPFFFSCCDTSFFFLFFNLKYFYALADPACPGNSTAQNKNMPRCGVLIVWLRTVQTHTDPSTHP